MRRLLPLAMVSCTVFSAPPYRGPISDHFDGRRFQNPGARLHGTRDFLKWQLHREVGPWRAWVDDPPGPPPPLDRERREDRDRRQSAAARSLPTIAASARAWSSRVFVQAASARARSRAFAAASSSPGRLMQTFW